MIGAIESSVFGIRIKEGDPEECERGREEGKRTSSFSTPSEIDLQILSTIST